MAEQGWIFIETWAEMVTPIPYVLLLICRTETLYEIIEPKNDNKLLFSTDNYQDATFWLGEDEYNFVGRFLYEDA